MCVVSPNSLPFVGIPSSVSEAGVCSELGAYLRNLALANLLRKKGSEFCGPFNINTGSKLIIGRP